MLTRRRANSSPYSVKLSPQATTGRQGYFGHSQTRRLSLKLFIFVLKGVFNDRLCVLIPML